MTAQQRKVLLIGLAVVVGSYIVRAIVTSAMRVMYVQQQAHLALQQQATRAAKERAAKEREKLTPKPPSNSTAAATYTPPPLLNYDPPPSPLAYLTGVWRGRTAVQGRGLCDIRFEMRAKDDANLFSGYSTFTCVNVPALMSPADRANPGTAILNPLTPDLAELTGTAENNNTIRFKVDRAIGTGLHGCALTHLVVAPFGAGQLSAEWEEGACHGGSAILRRVPRTS